MHDLDPSWLRSFEAIACSGSLTRAARQVHRTQSALSTQLQQLETSLSVRLVERTTRSLALTEAGRRFLPHARRLLQLQLEARAAMAPAKAAATRWRIGVSEYFLPTRIGELLGLLREHAPGARFELLWSGSAALQALWDAGEVDLVITTTTSALSGARLLRREPLAWVTSAAHQPLPGQSVALVLLGPDCPVHALALAAMARSGIAHHVQLSCSGSQAVASAIRAGWGVGCLNQSAIPPDLKAVSGPNRARWPAPGRVSFYLQVRPELRSIEPALRRWAAS